MPLDVQPLSRPRRALLLAVLLGLLGGSLGFANLLVLRQKNAPVIAWTPDPFHFTTRQPLHFDDELDARTASIAGHPRELRLFALPLDKNNTLQAQLATAQDLFEDISGTTAEETARSSLANAPAIELAGISDDGNFTILRFAIHKGYAVAISYSGPTPYTDADKTFLTSFCATGVQLRR